MGCIADNLEMCAAEMLKAVKDLELSGPQLFPVRMKCGELLKRFMMVV